MRLASRLCCLLAVALAMGAALPRPVDARPATMQKRGGVWSVPRGLRRSRSVGMPWQGKLVRGLKIEPSEHLRYVGEYAPAGNFHGTWELVQLLHRAAARVAARVPGAKLSIGEVSRPRGGEIAGHHSHESGRDADVGFYMLDAGGRPHDAFAFARFDDHGRGMGPNKGLVFDRARNWELVAKLVADGDARVQYIFVHDALERRLLEEGRRRGAPKRVLDRAAAVMVKPRGNHPHRNHFHVRIYCGPAERPGCTDRGPIWPWYPGEPPALARAGR